MRSIHAAMARMTSRERIVRALNHEEPDRVPIDIGGGSSTSIVIEGYERLKEHLGIRRETATLNRAFRVAMLDEEILGILGSDCYPLGLHPPRYWSPPPDEPDCFTDIWGLRWRQVIYKGRSFYYELTNSPLADAGIGDLETYPWPDPLDPGYTDGLADEARQLFENTEYALIGDGGFKSFWELGYLLRGYDRFLMDLAANPDFVEALLGRLFEINIAATEKYLHAVGPYIQAFRTADDMATQKGLLMSPEMYRRFIKPLYKKYYGVIRSMTDAKIFYHSCGNVVDLLDDFIEIGLDIINPVQVSAMPDTASLKKRFGDRLVFWGGIDTQHVLPGGTVQEVEREVRRRIQDLGPGGGFVLAAVHNIQPDVPPENIVAMAAAARKYGNYPLHGE
jgi:uroporphyrinogen decarboxylase